MTGIAFLKRLTFQLDFLNEFDQKTVIAFYERKLSGANTLLEEEAIVKSFGSPEHIAKKLKEAYLSHLAAAESASQAESHHNLDSEKAVSSESTENTELVSTEDERQDEEIGDDLIFSKPAGPKKAAEMIHSLENKEVKSLYGEKVVIEDRTEPVEEIIIEPIDDENGLTEEEIRLAKEETLEKANSFTTASIEIPPELLNEEKSEEAASEESSELPPVVEEPTIAIETESAEEATNVNETPSTEMADTIDEKTRDSAEEIQQAEEAPGNEDDDNSSEVEKEELNSCDEDEIICASHSTEEMIPVEKKAGIITRLFPATMSKSLRIFLTILLSAIVSPILLIVFGAGILSYAVTAIVILAVAILAFALIAALIVLGIAELIYGFSTLFDTVSVALIEIGIGTAVFGIVTAIAALIYEFLFGVIPKAIKGLTKYFVRYLKKVSSFLYGGNA